MLLEHSMMRFRARDQDYAQSLLARLATLREDRLIYDLLRFEAHLCLNQKESAERLLRRARESWGEDPRLSAAAERL
jgi:hypothetical protein